MHLWSVYSGDNQNSKKIAFVKHKIIKTLKNFKICIEMLSK